LVGVAPLVIYTRPGSLTREVFLLGTGVTDYLDILVEPGLETVAPAAFFSHLAAHQNRWDVLDFQQLRSGSPLLDAEGRPEWTTQIHVQEVCPVLPLPAHPAQLAQSVPAHMLEKLMYYRRRIEKLGKTQIERAREENFAELFDRFLVLHRARWQSRSIQPVLADHRLQQFHLETAERFLHSGCLRLYGLRLKGQLIAAVYSFLHRGRAYYYLSGLDPEFSAVSPGTLLIGHAIEQAIAESCTQFDFLRGREVYKYMWGAKGRLNFRRQFLPVREAATAS
jgi:CelD/BcsL family acetyltransferase involved in cellulose biosynthesis